MIKLNALEYSIYFTITLLLVTIFAAFLFYVLLWGVLGLFGEYVHDVADSVSHGLLGDKQPILHSPQGLFIPFYDNILLSDNSDHSVLLSCYNIEQTCFFSIYYFYFASELIVAILQPEYL